MVALSPEVFAQARTMMVDSQLRPNRVNDVKLLGVFGSLPREIFLPAAMAARAYTDENIRMPNGRAMLAPMATARLIQDAGVQPGEKVLVVGSGTGYAAAALAQLGANVTALEEDNGLLQIARLALAQLASKVVQVTGPLAAGWAAKAPYDVILIEGAVDLVPEALANQLSANGRIVLIRHDNDRVGCAAVGTRSAGGIAFVPKFDCSAPLLPGLAREAAFVF